MRPKPEDANDISVPERHRASREIIRDRIVVETSEINDDWYVARDPTTGREETSPNGDDHARKHLVRSLVNDTCLGYECEEIVDHLWCPDCTPRSCYGEDCTAVLHDGGETWWCYGCRMDRGLPMKP